MKGFGNSEFRWYAVLMLVLAACVAGLTVAVVRALPSGEAEEAISSPDPGLRDKELLLSALRTEIGKARSCRGAAELRVLRAVNEFFNRVSLRPLAVGKVREARWATPDEFARGKGDPPADYVIAKYYALTSIGVPAGCLRVFIVGRRDFAGAHYVLAYYRAVDAMPMILDHLDPEIRSAEERADIRPIYSFDPDGAAGVRHRMWREMSERIPGNKA